MSYLTLLTTPVLKISLDLRRLFLAVGQVDGQLCLTLTGEREDGPRVVRTGILDVAEDDEGLLEGAVPRTDDGASVVLKQLLSD